MDRDELTVLLINEQRDWRFPGRIVVRCPWCNCIGGSGPPPYGLNAEERAAWKPIDRPHEWFAKRNRNLPDDMIFVPINTVLLHKECHARFGQTKRMTRACMEHKKRIGKGGELRQYIEEIRRHLHDDSIIDTCEQGEG